MFCFRLNLKYFIGGKDHTKTCCVYCIHEDFLQSEGSFKGIQMRHYVMVSLWCESLLTNARFRFPLFKNKQSLSAPDVTLKKKEKLPNDSGRPLSYNNFTDKEIAAAKNQYFSRFLF